MAKKWSEVVSSERFQALEPEKQAQAQRQYFDTVVVPKAQERGVDLAQVENQFFTQNPLQGAPVEEKTQDVVLPEPPQDLTGQTQVEKPVEGSTWAPLPAQKQGSNWADTAQPSNVERAGYRGDGTVNYDDPRWRGKDAYSIASATAVDDVKKFAGDTWDTITNLPNNFGEVDAYTQQVRDKRDSWASQADGLGAATRPKTKAEIDEFGRQHVSKEYLDNLPITSAEDHKYRVSQLMKEDPNLSYDEAYNTAFLQQGRAVAQAGAAAAATAATGGAPLLLRMGAAGLADALTGQAVDMATGKEFDTGKFVEEGVWGSLGGVVGGKAGKAAAKSVAGKSADDLVSEAGKEMSKLDDLAKQAQVKQSVAASKSNGKVLDEVLEGTESITAKDMIQGRATAETLAELSKNGAKVDVSDALSSIKNKELRAILEAATPLKNVVNKARGKVDEHLGEGASELLGLGAKKTASATVATRNAIDKTAETLAADLKWSQESLNSAYGYTGAVKESFDKVYTSLNKVQSLLQEGQWARATKELNRTDNKVAQFSKMFGETSAGEIQRMRQNMLTIAGVGKTTKGHSRSSNIFQVAQGMGIPTILTALKDPTTAAALYGSKKMAGAVANKIDAKKVVELEKALGGKLRVDAKAEKMLKDGQDIGTVIGYLVSKQLSGD